MKYNNKAKLSHTILSLSLASLLLVSVEAVNASANHVVSARYVNAIQTKQAKSIEVGVSIGRLTPKEARKLRKEQYDIIGIERDMRKDGVLNASELSKLFEKLEYAQNHINKLLRNNISSYGISRRGRANKNDDNTTED